MLTAGGGGGHVHQNVPQNVVPPFPPGGIALPPASAAAMGVGAPPATIVQLAGGVNGTATGAGGKMKFNFLERNLCVPVWRIRDFAQTFSNTFSTEPFLFAFILFALGASSGQTQAPVIVMYYPQCQTTSIPQPSAHQHLHQNVHPNVQGAPAQNGSGSAHEAAHGHHHH